MARWWLTIVLVITATLLLRMSLGAYRYVQQADVACANLQHDDRQVYRDCARGYRRAAAYYFPGNPWVKLSLHRLYHLASELEKLHRYPDALHIWHELRSAILSLRGAYQPFADLLPHVNDRIVVLTALTPDAATVLRSATGQKQFAQRLTQLDDPHPGWVAAVVCGFVAWVAAAFCCIWCGLDATLSIRRRPFTYSAALTLLFFVLWAVGLRFA